MRWGKVRSEVVRTKRRERKQEKEKREGRWCFFVLISFINLFFFVIEKNRGERNKWAKKREEERDGKERARE